VYSSDHQAELDSEGNSGTVYSQDSPDPESAYWAVVAGSLVDWGEAQTESGSSAAVAAVAVVVVVVVVVVAVAVVAVQAGTPPAATAVAVEIPAQSAVPVAKFRRCWAARSPSR
jgi:hypothetical protein